MYNEMSTARSIFQGKFGRIALLEMNRSLVTHAHRACHLLFKAGGRDTAFEVRDKTCHLTDGSAVVVNAWEQHAYTHICGDDDALILALYIDPSWLASIDRHLIVSGHAEFFSSPSVEIGSRITMKVRDVSSGMISFDDRDREQMEEAVFSLVIEVADAYSNRKALSSEHRDVSANDHRVRRAIKWLREHAGQPLDIEAMAREAGLSRSHLFERFKKVTGLTPAMFLNTLRMEAAHPMLTDYDRPLIDVGLELGFEAQGNFSRFFRDHQGISPSEYRRVAHLVD
jgi:AraC-like DNA-binding protein